MKYFIESNGKSGSYREWVLDTQLEPKDVPLLSKPEDIPEKSIKAWIKVANGKLNPVTVHKVECKLSIICIVSKLTVISYHHFV